MNLNNFLMNIDNCLALGVPGNVKFMYDNGRTEYLYPAKNLNPYSVIIGGTGSCCSPYEQPLIPNKSRYIHSVSDKIRNYCDVCNQQTDGEGAPSSSQRSNCYRCCQRSGYIEGFIGSGTSSEIKGYCGICRRQISGIGNPAIRSLFCDCNPPVSLKRQYPEQDLIGNSESSSVHKSKVLNGNSFIIGGCSNWEIGEINGVSCWRCSCKGATCPDGKEWKKR